ncbi:MAG: MFS transporter [Henriciella sp.]|nr:MFS transporter [Henriciella sp.]
MSETVTRKPGLLTRLAYGVGGAAGGIKNNGFEYVLLLFYSQVLGLPAFLVVLAMGIALVLDAVSDPVVGYWSDNLKSRFGRRHPFIYVALIPVAIAYFLVWNPPEALQGTGLFVWLLVLTITVRLTYTLFEVPHHALAAELTQDYDARTSLMSFRYFFAWVGGLTVQIILFVALLQPSEGDPSGFFHIDGWHAYGLLAACCIFTSIAITSFGTHRHIPHLKPPPPQRRITIKRVFGEISETASNPSFRALFIATLFGFVASGTSASLNQYINGFFWEFTADQIGGLTTAVYLSALMALGLAPLAGRFLGKKRAAIIIGLLAFTIAPTPVFLRLFGLLPANGTDELYTFILIVTVVDVALIIAYQMLAASMVADVVEQSELATGRRSEGIFFAGISFIRKLAQFSGLFLASIILSVAAIEPGSRAADVGEASVRTLGWGYAIALLSIWMMMIVAVSFYRISREEHEQNLQKLSQKAAE